MKLNLRFQQTQFSKSLTKIIGRSIFAILATMVVVSTGWAQDLGVVVGVRADNADATAPTTLVQRTSFQAGLIGKFEVSGPLWVRSGFIYTQRSYGTELAGTSLGDFKATYFEVPVGLLYKFSDYGGAFVGGALSMNLSKDCVGSCTGAEVNSSPVAIQVGGSFKVAPQFGFEVYYESMASTIAKDIKNGRAIVANVMITFD